MDNANTREYLDKIRNQVVENLKRTAFAPSVQMTDVPRNPMVEGMDDDADDILDDLDEDENKDKRFTERRFDQFVEKVGELSDSEDEETSAANGVRRQPGAVRRRNLANYRNLDPLESGMDSGIATPQEASSVADGDVGTGLDTNMTDAPRTEPEIGTALDSAELTSQAEGTPADGDRMVVESEGPTAASQQPSPPQNDEDINMEDAGPATTTGAADTAAEPKEEKPAVEAAPTQPASPPRAQSPAKDGPEAAGEKTEPAPGAETEASKETAVDEVATKQEE